MTLITLAEAKAYLRVDTADEDGVIIGLLSAAARLCADVARLTNEQWTAIDSDQEDEALTPVRETMKVAILYALGYLYEHRLYEHREDADHHDLTMTLRSLLFAIREGVV